MRSTTPNYKGFKIGWGALNIPVKPQYGRGEGSFKAGFQLQDLGVCLIQHFQS